MEVPIGDSEGPEPQRVSEERKAALVGQILRGELTPQEACEREGLSKPELERWVRAYTRAARRAMDDEVVAALAAHGLEIDDPQPTEFSGNLDSMGLPELIQTIQYGKKDAHIRIAHDGEQSAIWCAQGDVVDAVSAKLTGSAAMYRILGIERGQLHATFAPVQRPRTIHASTQALMLEAAKRSDECAQLRSRLGDTLNIYVPSASAPPESEIEPDQAAVLRAFDGDRSVEQVVYESELPDLETLGLVARLLDQEWLVIKPFQQMQRIAPRPAAASGADTSFLPTAASLVSRLSIREPRHRLWASALAGVAVVAGAFAIGFYSAQASDGAVPVVAVAAVATPACGANLAPLPDGFCLDRAEITAGEYQACVRSGACEPVQREFDVDAPSAAPLGDPAAPAPASGDSAPLAPGATTALAAAALPPAASDPTLAAAEPTAPAPGSAGAGSPAVAAASAAPATALPAAAAPATSPTPADATAHCNAGLPGRERYPVNCVTVQQARRYCEWRGGRLPLRTEWELAASERPLPGVTDLIGGLSEWTTESTAGAGAARERYAVLGGGLDRGSGTAGTLTRLYMNANAQGRSVGFRCVVQADTVVPVASSREISPR